MGKWVEIHNDYFDVIDKVHCIDAWETWDENEQCKVIATIDLDDNVVYYDTDAMYDEEVQEYIKQSIEINKCWRELAKRKEEEKDSAVESAVIGV